MALGEGELCVCQLVDLLDLASSTISRHMSILSQAYLVDSRKEGRWVYYRRAGVEAPEPVRAALEWIDRSLADSEEWRADRQRIAEITALPPELLCRARESV
jgi:DNA-binding transcriptional ArsR family regulator